ncbi:hypothetical protein ACFSJW_06580 [Flavobacterium artemisiae]|uniref:Uncharacterized protein n=1 Tax=Flavobacterium artemisiae TaxID=2126556 RepID=A0ABW4HDF7_9FLAO
MKLFYFLRAEKTSLFLFILCLTATMSLAQSNQNFDCKILKNIKLKYTDNPDKTAYLTISGNKHVEYLESGKYFIKSDLEWLNDCEYNAKMTEITLPEFPFKAGEIMNVKFENIEGNFITGRAMVRGSSYPIKFEIIR